MSHSDTMTIITFVAALVAAPLGPLGQTQRRGKAFVLWLVGYAVVLFAVVGPVGGRDARDAVVSGFVIGIGAAAVTIAVLNWSTKRAVVDAEAAPTDQPGTP